MVDPELGEQALQVSDQVVERVVRRLPGVRALAVPTVVERDDACDPGPARRARPPSRGGSR